LTRAQAEIADSSLTGRSAKKGPATRGNGRDIGVSESGEGWPLVADRQFILATRDTGYRGLPAAVSELVDNALQAGARCVHIFIRETLAPSPDESERLRRRVSIAVLDDGSGMDTDRLRTALQFGGSERFNDRTGFGRFGLGLPNSSVSQSRRVEVYSWRKGRSPLFCYLDVDEIALGMMREVPAPRRSSLPEWLKEDLTKARARVPQSGTLVQWPDCDRLPYRKATTIRSKLIPALGRTYRYAIRAGTRLFVDGEVVKAIDPMMEWGSAVEAYGAAVPYGDELRYQFKIPSTPERTSTINVRFSVLPIERWASLPLEVRREFGVIGGAGVSVVRAGREVDYGWHLMGGKRRENYDDWWRCEVRFDPELDEYFGVTHSKQGVTPHPTLQEALAPDIEQIARALNLKVRTEFRDLAGSNARTPRPHPMTRAIHLPREAATLVGRKQERFLPTLDRRIRSFQIVHAPVPSPRFFVAELRRGDLVLTLNTEHPLHRWVDGCTEDGPRKLLDLLLLAAARAELAAHTSVLGNTARVRLEPRVADSLNHFFEAWGDALAAYLSRRT
jgi:hypothetical protein